MFMKRNLMKITIMTSEMGHVSLVFECTRVPIFNWTEIVRLFSCTVRDLSPHTETRPGKVPYGFSREARPCGVWI